MIPNYSSVRPQLLVAKTLAQVASGSVPRTAALVIGPQYFLSRYGHEQLPQAAFDSAGQLLPWQYMDAAGAPQALPSTRTVEAASAHVYGTGLEAVLAGFTGATATTSRLYVENLSAPHIIRMGTAGSHATVRGAGLSSVLGGREVAVGDVAYISGGATAGYTTTRRRRVTRLIGEAIAATIGTDANRTNGLAQNVASNPAAQGSAAIAAVTVPPAWAVAFASSPGAYAGNAQGASYQGKHGDLFTLEVIVAGAPGTAAVRLTSASGQFSSSSITTVDESGNFRVTNVAGVNVLLDPPGGTTTLTVGQIFTFTVFGAYARLAFPANLEVTGTYTGTKDTTYRVRVLTGSTGDTATGAVVEVTDTQGLEETSTITVTEGTIHVAGTLGLSLEFNLSGGAAVAQGGLRKGDQYLIHAKAATVSTSVFDRVEFDAPVVDVDAFTTAGGTINAALAVEFRKEFSGLIAASAASNGTAWTTGTTGVTIAADLKLLVPARTSSPWVPFKTGVGTLSVGYRALVPRPADEAYVTIDSVEDITNKLGATSMDAELSYGVLKAFNGAQGRRVYAINTGGTTPAAFSNALARLKTSDEFSFIGALTSDAEVKALCKAHVLEQSTAAKQNPRRVYFGIDSPGSFAYLTEDPETGNAPTATVGNNGTGAFVVVTLTSTTINLTSLGVAAGDLFKLPVSELTYTVASVLNSQELVLTSGPSSAIVVAEPFELWKPDTVSTQKTAIGAIARATAHERVINVWYEAGQVLATGSGTLVPARFAACEIAGLRSAVAPSTPLSRTEITAVTSIPSHYTRYEPEDLDEIASQGVLIVTQDVPNGPVYIRHQLTSEVSKGNLYYEDSVGVATDYLVLLAKDAFSPYYGRRNLNRRRLAQLNSIWLQLLDDATKAPLADDEDSLIVSYRNAIVARHETILDRVRIRAVVGVQLPGNVIDVEFFAEVDLSETAAAA